VKVEITDRELRVQLKAKENRLPVVANGRLWSLLAICRSQGTPAAYTNAVTVAVIMISKAIPLFARVSPCPRSACLRTIFGALQGLIRRAPYFSVLDLCSSSTVRRKTAENLIMILLISFWMDDGQLLNHGRQNHPIRSDSKDDRMILFMNFLAVGWMKIPTIGG
jgi:hypothetical protein